MRIGELSERTGVPVATIKFYLREGLLPPGDNAGASNQSTYTDRHAHRLHLVRTLLQVGGLSVAAARNTIRALDDPGMDRHRLLGTAHEALPSRDPLASGPVPDDLVAARDDVARFLVDLGWPDDVERVAQAMLADALVALRRLGRDVGPEVFTPYAELADTLAAHELATLDAAGSPERLVEDVVIGTVVFEAALVALRRLAHAKHSSRQFAAPADKPRRASRKS